ncbi:MAG: hypothetical protein IMF19_08430, partial [Proteobacteria bacterium]|nr:hypothetical protein [Pseudomonadota bacterium]
MGRKHTFMDREFGREDYDPYDVGSFEPDLVFIGMSFSGEEMEDVWNVIKDVCERLELNAVRVDERVGSGFIVREITELIERAEFIIFDLSYERPNVYYELGYAHGVGNEDLDILLIAKEGTKIHFDIAPIRIRFYRNMEELRKIIRRDLKIMMDETRK